MVQRWKPSWVQGRMIPAGVHPIDGYVSAADHARIVAEAGAAVFAFHPEWTVTGMCDPDCLACRRLTELITEREKGYEEGKADAEQEHAAAWDRATFDSTAYEQGKRDAAEEARAAERRHWEARFRNAEQAHATALAEEVQTHLDSLDILRAEHAAALAEAYTLMGAAVENVIEAEQPRTITADGPEPVSLDDMGTDGQKWAQAFVDRFGGDEGLMTGWFANAIEAGRTAGMASGYPIEQPNLIHDGGAA